MMQYPVVEPRIVGWLLGQFITALAAMMLIPLGYGVLTGGGGLRALTLSVVITAAAGGLIMALSHQRPAREIKQREGILVVVLIWMGICFFGSLPFYFSPWFPDLTDAFFESASGFTTTGATVLDQVEVLSQPIQLWRCFSHWLGGMGIVLLGLAILPLVGQGGMYLYRAEFSGAKSQRLTPRVFETTKALWKIYILLTLLEVIALWLAGMDGFEAVCQSFSTLGTGGFSTRTASIAGFDSPLIEYIIIVFMLLSGMSFIQHYRLLIERQPRSFWNDFELRSYLLLTLGATTIITSVLLWKNHMGGEEAFRAALFQVSSIITTTGFVTDDYSSWYPLCQLTLLLLMFVGGCTGSTAGGIKVARVMFLSRVVDREFRRMAEPQGVFTIRLGGETTPEPAVNGLLNLVYLSWLVIFFAWLLLTALGVDILTALSAVVACVFNVGPGLGGVGPMNTYAQLPDAAKWILSLCMIAGRLEFYTLLVILTKPFWQR
jgi:trk system potassium uptake protein TrkH